MNASDSELKTQLEKYEPLMSQGKFRDVIDELQDNFGSYTEWTQTELCLLASRCLRHLGMDRTANAIIYHAWRKQPDHPALAPTYLMVIHRRHGAVCAWHLSEHLLGLDLSDSQRANILCEQADIVATFRDFSLAEKIIQQALSLSREPWIEHNEAYLLFLQDRYDESLDLLTKLIDKQPSYRPPRQLAAHILIIQNKLTEAVDMLSGIAQSMQCVSLLKQLVYLHQDLKHYDMAEEYIARLENMYYEKNKYTTRDLNYVKSDILCSQQRYEEALPFLEEKSFFHKKLSDSIKNNTDTNERTVLDVPFIRQHHMTCAPASMSAITSFWGTEINQQDIIQAICYDGTPDVDERRWLLDQGWICIEFVLEFDTLKQLIDLQIPVLLSTVEPGSAHLQIIVGYDQKLGLYFLRDPYHPRLQEILVDETHKYYASSGPRCMLMLPADKQKLITGIQFKDKELYDEHYLVQKALDENQRDDAYNALQRMIALDKNNRLTIKSHRSLAIYDNDEPLILQLTEKLLERYPEDVNFQLSKSASLVYMRPYQQALDYLQALNNKPYANFLIKSRLAKELVKDHRQQSRTDKLLRSLIRERSTDAVTLKTYADHLWARSEYKKSYDIYRFLTCLEDKVEQYASSYFKAARYFKESEQALQFLIDRYHRYNDKSSGPVISVFRAFNSLNRTGEGIDYLEQALEKRPDDGELLLFMSRQYFYINNIERSQQLLTLASSFVHPARYAEMAAELCEFQQDKQQAITHWRKVLNYEPLSNSANNSIVRLLNEIGNADEASQFIEQRLADFPGNYHLLRLKLNWCDDTDLAGKEEVYRTIIQQHQDDNWAHKQMSRFLLNQFRHDEALEIATESTSIQNDDDEAWYELGLVYKNMGHCEQAISSFKKAISLSCDCIDAYKPLLDCANNTENKKQQLQFIYDEIIKQITFGDALLEFQSIASQWFTPDELIEFLQYAVNDRPDLWQSWVALAIENRELGHYEKALELIDTAIDKFPLIPRLYLEKAEIYYYMNDLENMESLLRKTLEYSPDWHRVVNRLSEILEYQNKIDEAITLLKEQIKKTPLSSSSYAYLADLLWRNNDKHEAVTTLSSAVDLSPTYYWAWERLGEMCKQTDQPEFVLERIQLQCQKLPDNPSLASIHASLTDDIETTNNIYQEFLERHPQAVDLTIDYIHFLVQQAKYNQALDLCDASRWNNNIPIAIQANHAWTTYKMNNIKQAVKEMNQVVENDQNYYDGWRFLVNWYTELEDSDNVLRCIEHCQRLYPNSPNVLCYVAETLEKHAPLRTEEITQLLRQAYYLDPTNSYNGLTYIDRLLDNEDYSEAEKVITTLQLHCDDIYLLGRRLSFHCRQNHKQQSLDCWHQLLQEPDADDGLIGYAWNQLKSAKLSDDASSLIAQQRSTHMQNPDEFISPFAGEYWAYHQVKNKSLTFLEKRLKSITIKDDFDNRVYEGYLRSLVDQGKNIPKLLFKNNYHQLNDDPVNWGLICYIKTIHDEWSEVIKWMENSYQREEADQRSLYFYMLALRQSGDWDKAQSITQYALDKPRDSYFDEIIIWDTFDRILAHQEVMDLEELSDYIDMDNLTNITRYIFSLNKALLSLQERDFISAYNDVSPVLRQCQKDYVQVNNYNAINFARNRAHQYLKNTINTTFVQSMIWKWRLSNHF
ncbi:MAG: tetratricopeptide repeat protein [Gammaproteobacteria bacterium]|nr:tetratricopeptide repeat protein [Gammaproteobacteria bacterium]